VHAFRDGDSLSVSDPDSLCSFLGGTVGVTCGGAISGFAGFAGVFLPVALAALVAAALSLRLRLA
jgi:hypothetical protein